MKKLWWNLSIKEIVQILKTDIKEGLTSEQASERLEEYGLNKLPEKKRFSILFIFLNQFSSFIIWVLIGALIISGFLGEWVDALAIGIIVILNAIIGFFQEYKAEKSLESLKKLTKPMSKVTRDGVLQTIASNQIVPGDIVVLEAGDIVPADGRIIHSIQLAMQEASLTGESVPVIKNSDVLSKEELPIGDRKNMAFMGTIVVRGKGTIIITQTARKTELGKIASMLSEEEEPTPLQVQLRHVGYQLVAICFGIVGMVFLFGILRGHGYVSMLLTSLSLAVAAIPEGLPAVVTVALAIGVRRMARKNAIIRRLMSVETLGCTSVICTDKTGTLTKNEMTVRKMWVNNKNFDVTGTGYEPEGQFLIDDQIIKTDDYDDYQELFFALKIGVLCNNANLIQKNSQWQIVGDPTEGALLVAAAKADLNKKDLEKGYPLQDEIPFDSDRKRMSMIRDDQNGKILFVKGAPDVICDRSTNIFLDGQEILLTEEYKKNIMQANDSFATQALRVLAVAYKRITDQEIDESLEQDLVFVGLIAMIDPPRPEVKKAIEKCKIAGIRTVMITGDYKETAVAIGKEVGLFDDESLAFTGAELDQITDEDLKDKVQDIAVYARTSAEHKQRIVKAWRAGGKVVAVTGDGVNDAPAIKSADIGIAMGITGTEVTKEASDMVITDDNFASIVNAVEQGRGIYDNIVKFINYLLSANVSELLIIFIGTLFAFKDSAGNPYIPLLPIQLLWLNLITDGLPALALAMDPIDTQVMMRKPRNSNEKIISLFFAFRVLVMGIILALGGLIACHFGLRTSAKLGHTMVLTCFVALELVRVQMVRSQYNIKLFSNFWMVGALISSLILQIGIVYIPFFQRIFSMVPLGIIDWFVILLIAVGVWIVGSLIEKFFIKIDNNSNGV
ncbi:cation-translocating P-type ATPase [Candidatus Babeliales bacterium]|nr:cation-translocating P-type ATPase [Candidatus Babeliales bacterium]